MSGLFDNAVISIQLGVDDYKAEDPRRSLSAVRNFYAGMLLLAKEVLIRAAPNADPEDVVGTRYKPVLDGRGGVNFIAASQKTIDFETIRERLKDFNLQVNQSALQDLNRIRNDIEHYYTNKPREALRQVIAKAFPVAVDLFRLAGEEPHEVLGDAWNVMLEVRVVYEQELEACRATFEKVNWPAFSLSEAPFSCPQCHSELVAQKNPENTNHQYADAQCRSCGGTISAEKAIEHALEVYFEKESYFAATDGGDQPVYNCPECGIEAYVSAYDDAGCAWCEFVLDSKCARCMAGLTPENVSADNSSLCGYCGYVMSKDD